MPPKQATTPGNTVQTHNPQDIYQTWQYHQLTLKGTRDHGTETRGIIHLTATPTHTRWLSTNAATILSTTTPNTNQTPPNQHQPWQAAIPNNFHLKGLAAYAKRSQPNLFVDGQINLHPPHQQGEGPTARQAIRAHINDNTSFTTNITLEDAEWPPHAIPNEIIADAHPTQHTKITITPDRDNDKIRPLTTAETAAKLIGLEVDLKFATTATNTETHPIAYWQATTETGVTHTCVVLLK